MRRKFSKVMAHSCPVLRRLHYEPCGWSVLESFFRSPDNRVINPERTASTKNTKTILNNEIDKL
jgi:hypothetical protein